MFDVVICTFNSEHSIKECIQSLFNNFKILNNIYIVDGGSKDKTLEILKSFTKKNILIHIQPHLTLGQSREFAFTLPTTEYFLQVDSDVVIEEGFEKIFLDYYKKADVVEFGTRDWFAFDNPTQHDIQSKKYEKRAFFFLNIMKKESVVNYTLPVKNMEEELLRVKMLKDGKTWHKTGLIVADHYSKPMRYESRNIISLTRSKALPKFVYEDLGKVDRIAGKGFWGMLNSIKYVIVISLNLTAFIAWFKSISFFPINIINYFKGYYSKSH